MRILIAILFAYLVVTALRTGTVFMRGRERAAKQVLRSEQPVVYWVSVAILAAVAVFFVVTSFRRTG
jgi:hypothetical protein